MAFSVLGWCNMAPPGKELRKHARNQIVRQLQQWLGAWRQPLQMVSTRKTVSHKMSQKPCRTLFEQIKPE